MTGVEILAMEEVAIAFGFDVILFLLLWIASILVGALLGLITDPNNFCNGWFYGIMVAFLPGLILSLAVGTSAETMPLEYETQYKVIISDEVSMNDFLSKYEIINQEGKIYTVRERNGDNND